MVLSSTILERQFIYKKAMIRTLQLSMFLLLCVKQSICQGCLPQPTCRECVRSPGCAWCTQRDFLREGEPHERRCDSEESLKSRNCNKKNIINPRPDRFDLKNIDLSGKKSSDNVIQLKPQNLKFTLRVGVPHTFNVSFKRAEGYPIDMYYLMDLSFSMKDDLDIVKNLGQDILDTLKSFTDKIRIGFGAFVDKVELPYVSQVNAKKKNPCPSRMYTCQPAFGFQNILGLTEHASEFKRKVSQVRISGNLDSPEAGFDAVMQAAVCQNDIGWANVTRILVYTSDDTFHFAGDGRLAGIYEPHDGKCHLDENGIYDGTKFDYPSPGHLSRILSDNNIQLIFAVTEESASAYKALSKLIPQSVVGVLKKDSSNIVQLISEAYDNLSSTILLEHQGVPPALDVSYQSHCGPGSDSNPWTRSGECRDIKIHQQVNFTVRLNVSECLDKPKEFHFKVQGISETLKVTVDTICDCTCQDREESSSDCNGNGTLSCGICKCDPNFLGKKCECKKHEGVTSLEASCHHANSSQLCSGHGVCECGVCSCQSNYRGEFCECNDNSCERHNNLICGGNGMCNCGTCICKDNYTGNACQCSTLTNECIAEDETLCSGNGNCDCNQCHCNQGFRGKHCSKMVNPCQKYRECMIDIAAHGKNLDPKNSLNGKCGSAEVKMVETLEHPSCSTDAVLYNVTHSNGKTVIIYTDLPRSVDKTLLAIGSSVSGIIIIGLIGIIVFRSLLELRYRREYQNFLKAQRETDWKDVHNPLFLGPTTTTVNPMHLDNA